MARKNSLAWVLAILWSATTMLGYAGETPAEEETRLLAVLSSDAPVFDKAKACQRLAVVGSERAVPALAKLLGDDRLAHYARFALEPIPADAVDRALRQAMTRLEGRSLVGVIHSIGARQDAGALAGLKNLLHKVDGNVDGDPEGEVAAATATAIARIGSPQAARLLEDALGSKRAVVRAAVADACLRAAETLLETEHQAEAIRVYDAVRKAEVPRAVRLAALQGAVLARRTEGVPLLLDSLRANDPAIFALALGIARKFPSRELTQGLVTTLDRLPPKRQARLIAVLADRRDPTALPAVLRVARDGPTAVRVPAIAALETLGDASVVPALLDAAGAADASVAEAARATLEGLPGGDVDGAIARLLERADREHRALLIDLAGRRRIAAAIDALRTALGDDQEEIRLAAIAALGRTARLADLEPLAGRLLEPKTPAEAKAALEALKAAARRVADRDAAAEKLARAMADAPVAARSRVLEVFPTLGGGRALEIVSKSARAEEEELRATAIRILGEWRSEDAGQELLRLAKTTKAPKDRHRMFAGLRHLVLHLGFPKEERLALCRDALAAARDDRERRHILEALGGVRLGETLTLLVSYLDKPALREDAARAAVTVSERLVRSEPEAVASAMAKIIEVTESDELKKRAERLYRRGGGKQ